MRRPEQPWRVRLMAKGIEQVVDLPALGTCVVTEHRLRPEGRVIRNYYRFIRHDERTHTAVAVFERSR